MPRTDEEKSQPYRQCVTTKEQRSEAGAKRALAYKAKYALAMWKYILAFTFSVIGILEIVLALNAGLREAVMKTSPVRFREAESSAFLFAGISALVMGIGIFFFGLLS